jgi:hypothetical protein
MMGYDKEDIVTLRDMCAKAGVDDAADFFEGLLLEGWAD